MVAGERRGQRIGREGKVCRQPLPLQIAENGAEGRTQIPLPPPEPVAHERAIARGLIGTHQGQRAARDGQQGRRDTRRGDERGGRECPPDGAGEPRVQQQGGLRGARRPREFLRRLALQHEMRGLWWVEAGKEFRHDRCRDPEGDIGDHRIWGSGVRVVEEVRLYDTNVWASAKLIAQDGDKGRVALHGDHTGDTLREGAREQTATGADLKHRRVRRER